MYTALLIVFGFITGTLAAHYTVLPLPYMLAPLITAAFIALGFPKILPQAYVFSMRFRLIFIAIIGLMIGARVTPELVASLPSYWPSVVAIILFVIVAHSGNTYLFHKLGKYDKNTAFYAAAPGGLMESIAMGEAAGCNIQLLMLQQFLRIILTIALVPVGISLWTGAPVGSASGASLAIAPHVPSLSELATAVAVGGIGLLLGLKLKIPAGQLMGPMLAAACVSVSGLTSIDLPNGVINFAQVVIGVSLGIRFKGIEATMIRKALWLSLTSVLFMLGLGGGLTLILIKVTELPPLVLLISFAPGGVTEMSLIALSLAANPALVSLHHLVRILLTVISLWFFGPRDVRE